MRPVDLRSDTCSQPDIGMRQAMMEAPVGNETWEEDPSVNELLELAMEKTGKEAALFCCSGTMANLCAAMAHASFARFGAEIVMGDYVHSYWYEVANVSTVAGLGVRTVDCAREYMPLASVEAAIRPQNGHMPKTELLWLENTFMLGGGLPIPLEKMQALHGLAKNRGLKVHLDGARIFNAAYALGLEVREIASHADSVQFCLSKGLGAPFGSILAGDRVFIAEARRCRQAFGGGLRQAGIMAAAGTYGIRNASKTIPAAHSRCRQVAEGLSVLYPGSVDLEKTQTNILLFDAGRAGYTALTFCEMLGHYGIKASPVPTHGGERCRMLFYPGIEDEDVEYVLETAKKLRSKDREAIAV